MNRSQSVAVRHILRDWYPGADVTVTPEPGGAKVEISGCSADGTPGRSYFDVADDGILMRELRSEAASYGYAELLSPGKPE